MAATEAIDRAAQSAHHAFFGDYPIRGWDEIDDEHRESWFAVARAVLAAAPPTPSAPGVAELLAECRERIKKLESDLEMSRGHVRDFGGYVAPEGGQS